MSLAGSYILVRVVLDPLAVTHVTEYPGLEARSFPSFGLCFIQSEGSTVMGEMARRSKTGLALRSQSTVASYQVHTTIDQQLQKIRQIGSIF